jgi:hypothetical protein
MRLPSSAPMLTSTPVNATRPDDGIARSVTEYPALRVNTVKYQGATGGCFIGRKYGDRGACTSSIGVGPELGVFVVSKLGVESFATAELCKGGLGWSGWRGACAVTEIGQIRSAKAIFHTVRMRRRGMGRSASLRFQTAR